MTTAGDGPHETLSRPLPIAVPAALTVNFYPEGGQFVARLENRVFFTCRDSNGQSLALAGKIVDGRGEQAAAVETTCDGFGSFSVLPDGDEGLHLKIDRPAEYRHETPALPPAAADPKVVLSGGSGVFDAPAPLEFTLRAAKAGLPIVIAARCRGVTVGQQLLVARAGPNAVTLPLGESIGGVIGLAAYDYGVSPPRRVAQRLVFRRPGRQLAARAADGTPPAAPPSDALLPLLLATEPELLAGRAADFRLCDFHEEAEPVPPILFDNLVALRAKYEENLSEYRLTRTRVLNTLIVLSFFGGLALALLVTMLALLKIVWGSRLWLPTFVATVCCIVVSAV